MPTVVIDYKKCKHCGMCVDMCPVQVYGKQGEKVVIAKPKECIGCRACEVQCPHSAITIKD